jgi:hypothetical protein
VVPLAPRERHGREPRTHQPREPAVLGIRRRDGRTVQVRPFRFVFGFTLYFPIILFIYHYFYRYRATDWAKTPLGSLSKWPSSLKLALGICLFSRFNMVSTYQLFLMKWGSQHSSTNSLTLFFASSSFF